MSTETIHVEGSPDAEHHRSPAAERVARLAARSGLLLSHFEHRVRLPLPDMWLPQGRPDLGDVPGWQGGTLPEPKYQAFRHDLLIGSFHPGHRAKWTGHELCHGLVGFAWQPGASRLFHALAAWMAELLPVTLWYFFDEIGLQRCATHAHGGPLFTLHCADCEEAALQGHRPLQAQDERWRQQGLAFLERELQALSRAQTSGLPVGTRHATIDLANDGLAYAAAHGDRLDSETFERFAAQFFAKGQGLHPDLDALQERVMEVARHLLGEAEAAPLQGDRWTWIAQDLGFRLLTIRAETEGEPGRELDGICDRLAAAPGADAVVSAVADYSALHEDWTLPDPEQVFAVGYALDGVSPSGATQLAEGVASACPNALSGLQDASDAVEAFARQDAPVRRPIGRRFASWLATTGHGAAADLAKYEAAVTHAAPCDPVAQSLDPFAAQDDRVRLSRSAELLSLSHDVVEAAPEDLHTLPALPEPFWLAVVKTPEAEVEVIQLPDEVARALHAAGGEGCPRGQLGLSEEALETLLQLRVITPCAYALR